MKKIKTQLAMSYDFEKIAHLEVVSGWEFEYKGIKLVVHKVYDNLRGIEYWQVTEPLTGRTLGDKHETRKEAMHCAIGFIVFKGVDVTKKQIEKLKIQNQSWELSNISIVQETVNVLGAFLTVIYLPLVWFSSYLLMKHVKATELMWFLFWVLIPFTIITTIVGKIIEKLNK